MPTGTPTPTPTQRRTSTRSLRRPDATGETVSNPLPPGATGTDETFAPALLGAFRDGVSVLEQGIQHIQDAWHVLIDAVNGFIQRVNDYLDDRHFWQKPFDW